MAFNDRLKMAREDKELSQIDLATQIGVAKNTYSQYESGDRKPNYEILKKLADVLEVSIDYLLEKSDSKLTVEQLEKWEAKYNNDKQLNEEIEFLESTSKLRSVARLEKSKISDEEDKQIAQFIDFLISQKKQDE